MSDFIIREILQIHQLVGINETEAQVVEIAVNLNLTLACHTFLALALCQLNAKKCVLPQTVRGTS